MIFFANAQGTITSVLPSPLYQGSVNANAVCLVAPLPKTAVVTVAFIGADGLIYSPTLANGVKLTAHDLPGIETHGKALTAWTCAIPAEILAKSGTVRAQFTATTATARLSFSSDQFAVGEGVPLLTPPVPEDPEDFYTKILAILQKDYDIRATSERYLDITRQIALGETRSVTDGYFFDKGDYDITIDQKTFIAKAHAAGQLIFLTFDFANDGEKWTMNGEEVTLADYGITDADDLTAFTVTRVDKATVQPDIFALRVPQPGAYTFVFHEAEESEWWTLDDAEVELENFGISYDGYPSDGDTFTVDYGTEALTEGKYFENNAKYYAEKAKEAKEAAEQSAQNAAESEENAHDSEIAAGNSASAAATSETNAGNSASAAAGSASAAAGSAQEAGDHEDQAFIYRNEAEGFKDDAEDAKTAAEAAENAAQGFANEAYQSAQEAAEEVAQNAARTVVAELSNDGLYKLTISLKNGTSPATVISTAVVDFPLEGIKIVSGAYDSATGNIVLTLQNGQKITFPVSEIITGLATETYVNNRKVTACAFDSSRYILTLTFGDNSTLTADFSAIKTYIDAKAAAAEQNAKNYADDAADAALSEAKTYAEDKADDAELNAKAYTNNLLDELGLSVVDGKLCITYSEV